MSEGVNFFSEHTWFFIFLPSLLYYIFSCSNTTLYYSELNAAANADKSSILSSLKLSQSYRIIASNIHLAGEVTISEIEPLLRIQTRHLDKKNPSEQQQDGMEWPLVYPLEAVLQSDNNKNMHHFFSTTWAHDEELGRGYLLVSDAMNSGTVWRWEVGGGPITIGRSISLKDSGCRSNLWADCPVRKPSGELATTTTYTLLGSTGITMQSQKDSDNFYTGNLIVIEKGERRIVRMEVDGARTPLVLQVPTLFTSILPSSDKTTTCSNKIRETTRLRDPGLLLYTPFGDLIFTDRHIMTMTTCSKKEEENCKSNTERKRIVTGVYRMKEAVNSPPIPFKGSREAHAWTVTMEKTEEVEGEDESQQEEYKPLTSSSPIEILYNYNLEHVSGLAMGNDLTSIFIAGRMISGDYGDVIKNKYLIVKAPLDVDDDDDDDDNDVDDEICSANQLKSQEEEVIKEPVPGLLDTKSTIFFDMTDFFTTSLSPNNNSNKHNIDVGPAVAVDKSGNVYATYPGGIAIIDSMGELLATIPFEINLTASANNAKDGVVGDIVVPNSITFGRDGYLYVTSSDALMRLRVKSLPYDMPTNLIVPPKMKRVSF